MSGFGSQPYGGSPYGIGQPSDVNPNGGSVLKNAFNGVAQGSRRIDSRSKDYVLNTYGRIEGMSNVQQLVLLAVATDLGSSSMTDLGQALKRIDRITTNFERTVDSTLRAALAHLTNDNLVEIQSITTTKLGNGRAFIQLRWRDLTTSQEHTQEIR